VLVLPQIAADCDHIHRAVYGDIEAPIERLTKLTAPRTRVIERQPDERTIEMNVREMKDLDWDAQGLSALKAIYSVPFELIIRASTAFKETR
jgi:hypothetical protein